MNKGILILLGFLALVGLFGSIYIVDEREQVIITQFGKPVGGAITDAGLHFKLPFIQKVRRFDKRFLEWDGARDEVPTKDKRFIWVDTFARWQITDPLKYFERLRDEDGARKRLDGILDGAIRDAVASHNLLELVRTTKTREPLRDESEPEEINVLETITVGRREIRDKILANASTDTGDLGIEILDVRIKRINYAEEDVRKSVEDRMIAERERIAARFRSEGQGEASRIRGEKERELERILSEAERRAEELRGEADAQATEIYASAYDQNNQSRDFYAFLKSLEIYRTTFDKDTTVLLSTDGEFYRYLTGSE
jgi:membrane protease subunit HflC